MFGRVHKASEILASCECIYLTIWCWAKCLLAFSLITAGASSKDLQKNSDFFFNFYFTSPRLCPGSCLCSNEIAHTLDLCLSQWPWFDRAAVVRTEENSLHPLDLYSFPSFPVQELSSSFTWLIVPGFLAAGLPTLTVFAALQLEWSSWSKSNAITSLFKIIRGFLLSAEGRFLNMTSEA